MTYIPSDMTAAAYILQRERVLSAMFNGRQEGYYPMEFRLMAENLLDAGLILLDGESSSLGLPSETYRDLRNLLAVKLSAPFSSSSLIREPWEVLNEHFDFAERLLASRILDVPFMLDYLGKEK